MRRSNWPPAAARCAVLLAVVAAALLAAPAPAAAAVPPASFSFNFNGNLNDDVAGGASTVTPSPACPNDPCIDASGFGSDADGPFWHWSSNNTDSGGGLQLLTSAPIGDTYTILMKFAFNETGPSYRKIIDYKDRVDDTGFYFYNGNILFYNLGSASTEVGGRSMCAMRRGGGGGSCRMGRAGATTRERPTEDAAAAKPCLLSACLSTMPHDQEGTLQMWAGGRACTHRRRIN